RMPASPVRRGKRCGARNRPRPHGAASRALANPESARSISRQAGACRLIGGVARPKLSAYCRSLEAPMDIALYYAPVTCAMVPFITLTEAKAQFEVRPINLRKKQQMSSDY